MAKKRARLGFLTYEDMLKKIEEGAFDEYDINYTPDSHEQYLITPNKTPILIKSRVYVFDSTAEAYTFLNDASDTYVGQLVSIKDGDVYKGYIVNTNLAGKYYAVPLSVSDEVDYNTLTNRPIHNIVGTIDKHLVLDALTDGTYNISGQYKISELVQTTMLSTNPTLYVIEHKDEKVYIRNITASNVTVYTVTEDAVTTATVVTTDMLGDFATVEYVDARIAALDILSKDDIKVYVDELLDNTIEEIVEKKVNEVLDKTLDEKVNTAIDEKITKVDSNSILNLFGN